MKNIVIYLIASLALFACQDEIEVEKTMKPGKAALQVSVNIPVSYTHLTLPTILRV